MAIAEQNACWRAPRHQRQRRARAVPQFISEIAWRSAIGALVPHVSQASGVPSHQHRQYGNCGSSAEKRGS